MTLLSSADWPFTGAFSLLRQSQLSAMATARHRQNESYPLELKIRSHETPATTDLSEPLMNQALNCSGPIPNSGHTQLLSYRFCMENNHPLYPLLCSSLASPSLGPSCHIHPEAYTSQLNWPSYGPAAWEVTPTKNTAVVGDFNPIWKIWSSNWIIPPGKGEHQK